LRCAFKDCSSPLLRILKDETKLLRDENKHLRVGHGVEFVRYLGNSKPEDSFWKNLKEGDLPNPDSIDIHAKNIISIAFNKLSFNEIPFEICSTSNMDLLTENHQPIKRLMGKNIPLVLSTDNDGIFIIQYPKENPKYYNVAGLMKSVLYYFVVVAHYEFIQPNLLVRSRIR